MGQFGSLYDMMDYSVRSHTAMATLNYELSRKLGLFANLVYSDGRGSLGGISLDTTQVVQIPAGFNYAAVSEIGRYSALNVRRAQQVVGLNYQFAPNWMMTVSGFYDSYKDRQPYIIDANGRVSGAQAGVSYIF